MVWGCTVFAGLFGWGVLQSRRWFVVGKRSWTAPVAVFSLPLPTLGSQLSLRLPEASRSSYSLHQHQQPLNHPNLHFTSRRIVSASSGRSEASLVFPSSTVSGGSGSVSRSHSRSTAVGLGYHLLSRAEEVSLSLKASLQLAINTPGSGSPISPDANAE